MTALLLVALLLLVLVNGFFVAGEFALVRSRRARLVELARENPRYQRVLKQVDDMSEYLSACQFGITLASLGIGFLGEPALAELIKPIFGGLSHGIASAIAIALAYAIAASNWVLRLLRIDPEAEFEEGQTPQELRFLIAQARTGGHLDPGEAGMLQGVFHLHEQE